MRSTNLSTYTTAGTANANAFKKVNENIPGIERFMAHLLKQETEAIAKRSDESIRKRFQPDNIARFVDLDDELEGVFGSRRRILVRDTMRSIVERIISFLEGTSDPDRHQRWILLGGSRGCGKSVVGCLATILLASKGHVVLYEHRGIRMLLLSENVSSEARSFLDKMITPCGIPPISKNQHVCVLGKNSAHLSFFDKFMCVPDFIYVQDLGDHHDVSIPPHNGNGKRLIVSSPNALKLKPIQRNLSAKILIMKSWTLDEILEIKAVVPDLVQSRFRRVGGIPRWVTDKTRDETEAAQNRQIESLSLDTLIAVFNIKSYLELPSQVDKSQFNKSTDLIFRIEPISESDDSDFKVVLSSNYVMMRLAKRFIAEKENMILQFVSAIHKTDGLSEFRGRVLEAIVHRSMDKNKATNFFSTMSLLQLNKDPSPTVLHEDVPTMQFDSLSEFENISDLKKEQLRAGTYFYAKRKNEKTIDSFAIVDRPFVKTYFPSHPGLEKEVELFILFMQITVSNSHVVDGSVLRARQNEASAVLEVTELPMIFVFFSWRGGIVKEQAITRTDKKAFMEKDQFGPQYLIRLRGQFDEIAEMLVKNNVAEKKEDDDSV